MSLFPLPCAAIDLKSCISSSNGSVSPVFLITAVPLQRAYPASQLDAVAEPPGLPRGT